MKVETNRINPFFEKYGTPHETVPFEKIKLEDYEEAIIEGIKRENEEVALIISNQDEPTFNNTLVFRDDSKLDNYYNLLDRVSNVMSCMMSCDTNPELELLAQKMSPILTEHANDISLNPELFEKVKYVYENHDNLTPEEEMLLEHSYKGFVRGGALLDDNGKEKLRKLTEEAGLLTLQFSQNLLKDRNSFELNIIDEKQLDGLPDTIIESAQVAAYEKNKKGWLFSLDYPSYSPFLTYSTNRQLREKMYMAYNTLCTHDNSENNIDVCKRLINIRLEIANLLGYETYAEYVLEQRMASNVGNVYTMYEDLISSYKPVAEEELEEVKIKAREIEGEDFQIKPWDSAFFSHKLKVEKYNIDAEMLRPYFQLENVIDGVFGLAKKLYGITFKESNSIPVYHADVKAYEVYDNDGTFLAVFYADFFPRQGKHGGAWMTEFKGQCINHKGVNIRPHVMVVMNFTKPTLDKPALLTLGEVETFLHEFGHSLHGIFANTRFSSLSGTNVMWDFVELPSQFMENYAIEKDFLATFAFHYKTGEPMPDELIDRIISSRNFMVATACMRQLSLGLIDMAYYTLKKEFNDDIFSFEKKACEKTTITPQVNETCMTTQFSHIMAGGYSAGYYSYKWAEVLDADAFSVFKKEGIFNRETAQRFRDCILSKGGTEHPMKLYKRFKGSEPNIYALLDRNGITSKTK